MASFGQLKAQFRDPVNGYELACGAFIMAIRVVQSLDRYFMELPDGTTLDTMGVECFAKYANDAQGGSKGAWRNNAVITLDDNDRVCLRATRRILAGKEVLCGYGKRYWQRHGAEKRLGS